MIWLYFNKKDGSKKTEDRSGRSGKMVVRIGCHCYLVVRLSLLSVCNCFKNYDNIDNYENHDNFPFRLLHSFPITQSLLRFVLLHLFINRTTRSAVSRKIIRGFPFQEMCFILCSNSLKKATIFRSLMKGANCLPHSFSC